MTASDSHHLDTLLSLLLEEQLTEDEQSALTRLLRDDPEARIRYQEHIELHAFLRWRAAPPLVGEASETGPQQLEAAAETAAAGKTSHQRAAPLTFLSDSLGWLAQQGISARTLAIVLGLGLASYFAGLLLLVAWQRAQPLGKNTATTASGTERNSAASARRAMPGTTAAEIVAQQSCVWGDIGGGARNTSAAKFAAPGEVLRLESGLAQLIFRDGAQVTIEGPTTLTLRGGGGCDLAQGRLAAYVPRQGVGFTVATPSALIVDRGTEFAVEVAPSQATDIHVVQGSVEVTRGGPDATGSNPTGSASNAKPQRIKLSGGQAMIVSANTGDAVQRVPADKKRFDRLLAQAKVAAPTRQSAQPVSVVWLGNLFDDPRDTPLADALQTDTYGAAAEVGDLGVERVLYGGDAIKTIAPHVQFDFGLLGWADIAWGGVANDAWIVPHTPAHQPMEGGGIRTLGSVMTDHEPRIEDGIGTHANSLVTFDLDEIRAAAGWDRGGLRFICDRAGLNDDTVGDKQSSAHAVVLVSTPRAVVAAIIDGRPVPVQTTDFVSSLIGFSGEPLRRGTFAIAVAVPAEARYLTLAGVSAGKEIFGDHIVWSGARLEAAP